MSRKHILAKKNLIKPYDLAKQKLLIMKEGNSPQNDKIRHFLQKNYPQAILEDVPIHYSVEHFHSCEEENCLLSTLNCRKNVPFKDRKQKYFEVHKNFARFFETKFFLV